MNKKSFTLIELLVVIAIIGILSSLVIARFSDWGDNARIANTLQWSAGVHRTLGANLVGHWPLNGDLNDISGYGNNGTMHNFVGDPWVDGLLGTENKSLYFSGDNDYVELSYISTYNIREAITLSIWMKRNTDFNQLTDVHFLSRSPSWFFYDSYDSGNINGDVYIDGTRVARRTVPVPFDDKWYHVIYTYNSVDRTARMYKNGELFSSITLSSELDNVLIDQSSANFSYMGHNNLDRGMSLSDARIYNAALTAEEVGRIYAETKDKYLVYE